MDDELEDTSRVEYCCSLFEHTLIDSLEIKQVVHKAKHEDDLKRNQLEEVFYLLFVAWFETDPSDQFDVLLNRSERCSHLMGHC